MELTTEQRDLRDAVRGLLARHRQAGAVEPGSSQPGPTSRPGTTGESHPTGQPRAASDPTPTSQPGADGGPGPGYDGPLWRRLCGEIGVAGLAIPERYGGAGAGLVEACLALEELGRGLVPSPLLGSAVLTGQALLACGDEEACRRRLPGIAGGTVAALAWAPEAGRWDPGEAAYTARPGAGPPPGGWTLTGTAHHVLDGDTAGVLLAAARAPDGIGLFEVDPRHPGVARHPVTTMDTTRRLAAVALDGVPGRRLGAGPAGPVLARARDLACIALAAEQAGAAQRALELTVAYTKTRVQFGRPIGSFQALQHRMADLHVLVESAWSLCYAAAFAAGTGPDAGLDRLGPLAAAAKAHCSQALTRAAGQMIQLHGAIGITWEHDAHRYFKRAHGAGQLLGRPEEHIARIAAALIDG
jgi:alkylation response protein AidB-like acyl-CoA dehydrogenase